MRSIYSRRSFINRSASAFTTLGLSGLLAGLPSAPERGIPEIPDYPLVLFDNFHSGSRRNYSYKSKLSSAQKAGFNGFEIVSVDPSSDQWKEIMNLIPAMDFQVWGLHWTTQACVDRFSGEIERDIEKLYEIAEASASSPIQYISLSLSGNDELRGPTIHESGSARAEDRHWERAFKIIGAFDQACRKNQITGALYPHTHWICDTPQSQQKILDGAGASHIGPAFCSHHWYAHKNALELDEALKLPMMQRLNYVVLTNGRFQGNGFPAVRFDQGEIDMAWLLAKLITFGYRGPISSQGWGIGGDPLVTSRAFVDTIRQLQDRFKNEPDLWPLK